MEGGPVTGIVNSVFIYPSIATDEDIKRNNSDSWRLDICYSEELRRIDDKRCYYVEDAASRVYNKVKKLFEQPNWDGKFTPGRYGIELFKAIEIAESLVDDWENDEGDTYAAWFSRS